jgi:tetratricopeptide (TPR) repeat protein
MNKQKFFITLLLSLFVHSIIAQTTHVLNDEELKYKKAVAYFQDNQFALAYPLFKELKSLPKSILKSVCYNNEEDLQFYFTSCELKLMLPIAANHATSFINTTQHEIRKNQLCAYLAHYFYLMDDFENALLYFDKTKFDNLENTEIADSKFEKGYTLFNLKQFEKARILFSEIIQLQENKYYINANYYYGFILFNNNELAEALKSFKIVESDEQYNSIVPYYIAEILYALGDKEATIEYVDSILKINAGAFYKKELQLLNAQLYFEKKQYKEAMPLFEDYVNNNAKVNRQVVYELSYCYYKNNMPQQAIEGFKQLSNEKDSMGQNSMYILGELYINVDDKPNARTAFQYCSYNSSNKNQQRISRLNYAKLSYELGFQDIALTEIKQYIKDYTGYKDLETPGDPQAHLAEAKELMISLLANTNNFDEGLELYKTLNQATPATQKIYARLLYGKSIQLISEQQLSSADDLLSKIIANKNSANVIPYAQYWKGEIAYRQQRYDDAIKFLENFVNSNATWMGDANQINAKYNLGYCWFQKEQFKNALSYFEKIIPAYKSGLTSIEQDVLMRSADCYYMLRDYTKASEIYDAIIKNNLPQADYAVYQKAMISGVKNSSEKIKLLNNLIKLYPKSSLYLESQMEIGLTHINDQNFASAIPYMNTVINSNEPTGIKPKAYLNLGLSYYNTNDNKNALVAYKSLIKLFPQSEEASEAMSTIKDIYVEDGNLDEYVNLMKENGINIAVNEADSLSFAAAQLKYDADDCLAAIKAFDSYIYKYKNGAYLIDANYYKGVCLQKSKDNTNAIKAFEFVFDKGVSKFFENATLELARLNYFEQKNYTNAKKYFEALNSNATTQENKLEAQRGLVRCYYQLHDYSNANQIAKELLNNKGISNDDKSIAALVLGKSQEVAKDSMSAIESFKSVIAINKAAWGAEARYEAALCNLTLKNLSLAEKMAMSVIKETGSYELWVTKSYILLGDIFMLQKDFFNAKATFESVAKNAAIPELKQEAQQKLNAAIIEEKKSSKIGN